MAEIVLNAEKRTKLGGSTALQLRAQGRVPGIIYGHGDASIPFHVKYLDLRSLVYTPDTHTVSLVLDGKATRCILREVQFHPVTDRISHIDLIALHAGEKIRIDVPISLVGTAAGVKDGGVVDFVMHKLSIDVLPDSIPQHIDLDISGLKIGHALHVSDLAVPEGYTIHADPMSVIVSCAAPKTEAVVEPDAAAAAAVPAEPEQIKKGKKEEEA